MPFIPTTWPPVTIIFFWPMKKMLGLQKFASDTEVQSTVRQLYCYTWRVVTETDCVLSTSDVAIVMPFSFLKISVSDKLNSIQNVYFGFFLHREN